LSEATLFAQAQGGCSRSLNLLMRQHEALVQAVVRRQVLADLSFEEALQAGRIGLWRAILGYDPGRGWAFSTYAWPAIMRHVWQAVKAQRRQPKWTAVRRMAAGSVDPLAAVIDVSVREALYLLVQCLPAPLRYIVVARYGLADAPAALYGEIGAALGVSGEWVRRLHNAALTQLRHPAHSQTLRSLLERHTLADYEAADALAQRCLRQRAGRHGAVAPTVRQGGEHGR
jgi:RNA polymerase sigma factor (sigma-70 family)